MGAESDEPGDFAAWVGIDGGEPDAGAGGWGSAERSVWGVGALESSFRGCDGCGDDCYGGGSDLYGSSALGGVINVVACETGGTMVSGTMLGAGEGTVSGMLRGDARWGSGSGLLAGQDFDTQGYILTAPECGDRSTFRRMCIFESGRTEIHHGEGRRAAWGMCF